MSKIVKIEIVLHDRRQRIFTAAKKISVQISSWSLVQSCGAFLWRLGARYTFLFRFSTRRKFDNEICCYPLLQRNDPTFIKIRKNVKNLFPQSRS